MSGSNGAAKGVVGWVITGLAGVVVLGFLVFKLFTSGSGVNVTATDMTASAVAARIAPEGVAVVVEGGPPGSRTGKAVYESLCFSCHATGAQGSPKFGDAGAWAARIAKGVETLDKHAIEGFNAMPARGGGADLTDDEVRRAVAYLANSAGAKFVEPPVGGAASGAAAAVDPAVKGKEIYTSTCAACHDTGAAGAPKFGDKAAWGPRLKDGADAAVAIGIKGLNAMPPKGGYAGSDEEFKAAAMYLINASK